MIRHRDLQLSDDLAFTRRSWVVERIGWAVLGALLIAGFFGLLGPGLLSGVKEAGPLTVEYDRFERRENENELRVRLAPGARSLWVENSYLDGVRLEKVQPEPSRVASEAGWTVFTFEGEEDVEARLEISPRSIGRLEGRFGPSKDQAVRVRQFVFP
jgi:hypothetical protein